LNLEALNDENGKVEEQDLIDLCHENLPWIARIGKYADNNTPFDWFDSKCHGEDISNASIKEKMSDDTLLFMINTA
jgi:hypothetical protein